MMYIQEFGPCTKRILSPLGKINKVSSDHYEYYFNSQNSNEVGIEFSGIFRKHIFYFQKYLEVQMHIYLET